MIYRFSETPAQSAVDFSTVAEFHRTTEEKEHSPLQIYDPDSADIAYARAQADELINISGAWIKIYIRTDNADYDTTWNEDPDPTYWNVMMLKGFFKPQPLETELKKWGAEATNRAEVVFSHRQVYEKFRDRMLRPGDVLQLPYNAASNSPVNYRVLNATPSGNFRYNWLYLTCAVEVLTADITVRPEQDMPVELDDTGGKIYDSL